MPSFSSDGRNPFGQSIIEDQNTFAIRGELPFDLSASFRQIPISPYGDIPSSSSIGNRIIAKMGGTIPDTGVSFGYRTNIDTQTAGPTPQTQAQSTPYASFAAGPFEFTREFGSNPTAPRGGYNEVSYKPNDNMGFQVGATDEGRINAGASYFMNMSPNFDFEAQVQAQNLNDPRSRGFSAYLKYKMAF
jgi:hypothetical protein